MIPITINSKKYKIKSIAELSTAEFIELSKIESLDYVKYISWQTKRSLSDSFFAVTSKTVEKAIGQVPDVTKLSKPKLKYVDYKKTISTVGQRHQVENSGLKDFELLVFCLAVSQAHSVNIDDVLKLQDDYLLKPWQEVLPAGFFFFKIYSNGRNSGTKSLKKLLDWISIWKRKKRPESKD